MLPPALAKRPTCFIAMPITTREDEVVRYGDAEHWIHVMENLFVKALEAAAYQPIRPVVEGSHLIHRQIVKHLEEADLVLCDLSGHNPNVFFELGLRTSLDRPVALVRDQQTELPFDTSIINTYTYDWRLPAWDLEAQQSRLAEHILSSMNSCRGHNPLWRALSRQSHDVVVDLPPVELDGASYQTRENFFSSAAFAFVGAHGCLLELVVDLQKRGSYYAEVSVPKTAKFGLPAARKLQDFGRQCGWSVIVQVNDGSTNIFEVKPPPKRGIPLPPP